VTAHYDGPQAPKEWVSAVTDRKARYAAKPLPEESGYVEPKGLMRMLSRGWLRMRCCAPMSDRIRSGRELL